VGDDPLHANESVGEQGTAAGPPDELKDIQLPAAPLAPFTSERAIHGPLIPPQQQILLYSADQWEEFIQEWAHFCLKKLYTQVQRFGGSGDHGIDVAGFSDKQKLQGIWDNYQCKHYERALHPTDVWQEFGKVLWHSFNGKYAAPRRYYFVAPRGAGTKLAGYLADIAKLKKALMEAWDKHVRREITETQEVLLEGEFLAYVEAFDFSIFDSKTPLDIIEDHRKCPYHAARFGGGLPDRPAAEKPPNKIAPTESRYVAQLFSAYEDYAKKPIPDLKALKGCSSALSGHFGRQREAFYQAESLRIFARENAPSGTFEDLQEDIYSGVIDTHDADHLNGYERVCKVTKAARDLQLTSNALIPCVKPKDRDGVCHHLANEDRLQWTKK
jgi:ABC-3C protein/restriction endonuclease